MYATLRQKISAESAERKLDYDRFEIACAEAHAIGTEAVTASTPTPMVVQDQSGKQYFVEGGVCGFAWVHVPKGTSRFARWLSKTNRGGRSYYGGVDIRSGQRDQSMERAEAYCRAYALHLVTALGVECYMQSRID